MFAVSLTVVLALTVGLATSALAAVPGDPFKLGKTKTVDRISPLEGSTASSMLRIDNNGTGSALQLLVEPGKAPLTVNAEAGTAKNLSADELDGKDGSAFFSGKTYTARRDEAGPGGGQDKFTTVSCDPGDKVLGGGGGVSPDIFFPTDDGNVTFSRPGSLGSWNMSVQDNGSSSNVCVEAICADFPPLRP